MSCGTRERSLKFEQSNEQRKQRATLNANECAEFLVDRARALLLPPLESSPSFLILEKKEVEEENNNICARRLFLLREKTTTTTTLTARVFLEKRKYGPPAPNGNFIHSRNAGPLEFK